MVYNMIPRVQTTKETLDSTKVKKLLCLVLRVLSENEDNSGCEKNFANHISNKGLESRI